MPAEREYLEYVGFFSVSILAVSASYLVNLQNPVTYLAVLLVPLAFGYSAYISRDSFKKASLSSLMTLFLIGANPVVSVVAIIVAFGIPLISLFSTGEGFKNYFGTVSIPLLIVGLLVGGGVYYEITSNPESKDEFKNFTANLVGQQAEIALETSGVGNNVQEQQVEALKSASSASIIQTGEILRSNMTDLNASQARKLQSSLEYAEREIPNTIAEQAQPAESQPQVDVSEKVSNMVKSRISDKYLLAVIPVVGMALYTLNPFVGLITAIFGSIIAYLSGKIEF